MNFSAKNPPHRQAETRWRKSLRLFSNKRELHEEKSSFRPSLNSTFEKSQRTSQSSRLLAAIITDDTVKQYLTKQNRKTIDFVLLVADDKFVRHSQGKVGKSGIANSTLNAGSPDKAIEEVKLQVQQLLDRGFVITDLPKNLTNEYIVFDKAKWHVNDDFPNDLDHHQSYVHSGLFICWLIDNELLEEDFKTENSTGINLLLSRQFAPSQFYVDYLDGVFDAEGLTQEAIKFTADYFDFEKGNYVTDYLATLDPSDSLPSLFHVADTWENYDKLKSIINKRYTEWKQADAKE